MKRISRAKRQYLIRLARGMRIRAAYNALPPSSFMVYGRDGNPMPYVDWVVAVETNIPSRVVKQTKLPTGRWVSTVWLGLDHGFGSPGRPLIFETMVFEGRKREQLVDLDGTRYRSEAEAITGHAQFVAKWWDIPKERLQ